MNWTQFRYFKEDEFRCRCGCGVAAMDEDFMRTLDSLRGAYKTPMLVSSGYRCPTHNEAVSATKSRTGPHTTGRAADIVCSHESAFELTKLAYLWGMKGIGWNQKGPAQKRFVHLDNLTEGVRPHIWTY